MALTKPRAYQIYDIDYKQAVRVVSLSNITLSGGAPNSVDGVNLSLNDRILVAGQTSGVQNGIYYVTTVGSGSDGTWTRSTDTDATGELLSGTIVMVTEGTTYADTQWKLTTNDPITIGSTALTFVQNYLANSISYGQTSFAIGSANANATISVAGTSNVAVFATNGEYVTGLISATGNVTGGNITTAGQVSATANITGGNILTSGIVSATGNVTGGNLLTGGLISSTGNVTSAANIAGANLIATSNVVGAGASISGNITGGNLLTSGLISTTGNITSVANITGGNLLTGGIVSAASHIGSVVSVTANITGGNVLTGGQVSATGNITSAGNVSGTYLLGNVFYATGISANKIYNGTTEVAIGTASGNANITVGGTSNVVVFATTGQYVTGLISASDNITSAANVSGGNLLTGGLVSATGNVISAGNISGTYLLGNVFYATGISASKIYNGTSEANIGTSGGNANISIGGTSNVVVVYSGGVSVTGDLTVTGNATLSGNILGDRIVNGTTEIAIQTASGNANISVGGTSNVVVWASAGEYVTGLISASGNITSASNISGGNILGNGQNLTGINTFSTIAVSGQSNVVADSIIDTLTLVAGTGISITTDAANDSISISSVSTSSIFSTGGDMGTVTESVTTSEDLGAVTDTVTVSYDLGSVVSASGLVYPSQLILPEYTPGTLPSASPAAQFIYLSTSSIGAMTAFSDGTNWRFTSSGNIVS